MEPETNPETPKEQEETPTAETKTSETPNETQSEAQREAPQERPRRDRKRSDDNVIFVGKKPTMSYVLAVVTQFSDDAKEVVVKARGRSISHAVDVAEVVRNKFVHGARTDVKIGTEEVTDKEGRKLKVSTISIALRK